jgi:anaerobic selenocysteine-containing dehydrogenase
MFMEHDDVYVAGGHSHIQIGPKLVDPPGECRSNHAVLQGLASRLGAAHRGFSMTAMELVDETLRVSGWPDAASLLRDRWVDAATDFSTAHFLDGFGHPDGRFRFAADWASIGPNHAGLSALPDQNAVVDEADAARPFRLVTAPARQFLNSTFTEVPESRRREVRPTALLHPDDAGRLGVVDGGLVRIGNARGEVVVHARAAGGQQPGVVVVESIWPNGAYVGGIGINALTSDEPALPAGGAVFHDTAVWLRAEPARQADGAPEHPRMTVATAQPAD